MYFIHFVVHSSTDLTYKEVSALLWACFAFEMHK